MIVPSIDLMNGNAVQLVGGRDKAIDAGDPRPIAEQFRIAGEIAVIDLDAAIGGSGGAAEQQEYNAAAIRDLLRLAPCRVGGGIRSVEAAVKWLDAGAAKVILGTAAKPEILKELPRERVIAALDADKGEVVVEGWRKGTGRTILDRMRELNGLVGGYLITFVEREGRMGGTNLDLVPELVKVAAEGDARVTIAGGVTTAEDIAALDSMNADAQVGMAIYSGKLDLADAIAAPVKSDRPDGLIPTIVADELGVALGLAYSSRASLREAVKRQAGVYHSRSRGGLWVKGETSGNTQKLLRIDADCDRDALRFTVEQGGEGFCHVGTRTCWGEAVGLIDLEQTLKRRQQDAPPGSYTARLFNDPALLRSKLIEEAGELCDASEKDDVIHEAADVLYFAMCAMRTRGGGVSLADVSAELERRSRKVTRRPGNAKPV